MVKKNASHPDLGQMPMPVQRSEVRRGCRYTSSVTTTVASSYLQSASLLGLRKVDKMVLLVLAMSWRSNSFVGSKQEAKSGMLEVLMGRNQRSG